MRYLPPGFDESMQNNSTDDTSPRQISKPPEGMSNAGATGKSSVHETPFKKKSSSKSKKSDLGSDVPKKKAKLDGTTKVHKPKVAV